MMSTPCCWRGSWFSASITVSTCAQFCMAMTSARSMTSTSMLLRKSLPAPASPLLPAAFAALAAAAVAYLPRSTFPAARRLSSASLVAKARGDATMMSDSNKSAKSLMAPRVILMPSLKWSSVLPENKARQSAGLALRLFLVPSSIFSSSASGSVNCSTKRSLPCTESARVSFMASATSRTTSLKARLRWGSRMSTLGRVKPWSLGRSSTLALPASPLACCCLADASDRVLLRLMRSAVLDT
mmetsp:Transcript_4224/g.11378  ORF Transcript_4224/g.11378 Transcript_4224/m.11378 type:complete len:242 (-) Transcript_4224:1438-2163(-)